MQKKKILFSAHDPGGYNLLDPLIDELLKEDLFDVYLLLIGPALVRARMKEVYAPLLKELNVFPIDGYENESDIDFSLYSEIFNEISPDVVFVSTSINSNIERYSIHLARLNQKPSFVYIDSWTGDNVRFVSNRIEVTPDQIIVCDELMAEPYRKFESLGSIIHVIGNLHLENLYQFRYTRKRNNYRKSINVLFVTENIAHYYPKALVNEYVIVSEILRSYNIPQQITLTIRPHPLESRNEWTKFISDNYSKNEFIRIVLDESSSISSALSNSEMVIGISTMALIESSILGIPTFSYQNNIIDRSMLYIPYDLYNIHIIKFSDLFSEIIQNLETFQNDNTQFTFPFLGAKKKMLSLLKSYAG